jgi:sugar lactone lactonase YvrE
MKTNRFLAAAALTLAALTASPVRAQHVVGPAQIVTPFDHSKLETPEGLAIDKQGNRYLSLNLTGEIRKVAFDGSQSTLAVLPLGAPPLTPCFGFVPIMGPPAFDQKGNLFLGVDSCDPALRGLWRVTPEGEIALMSKVAPEALLNGIAIRGKFAYLADTALQIIWRIPLKGGAPQVWADSPLLKKRTDVPAIFPGPNGVEIFEDELYVSVSGGFRVVALPLDDEGEDEPLLPTARPIRVHAVGTGCDDFAFDVLGNLYCGTDPFNTLVRIAPDGTQTVLLTAADGLDGPTAAAFGRKGDDRFNLYVTNGAFPFFPTPGTPKLLRVKMDVVGAPR